MWYWQKQRGKKGEENFTWMPPKIPTISIAVDDTPWFAVSSACNKHEYHPYTKKVPAYHWLDFDACGLPVDPIFH